ncbi:MAG: TIGR03557 family F420-dependent LLM class oxidoreductase [Candidatus Brockarchaeota archaeon]|nr:TIGR03557 family F420-dependent LLM class oxidoreductase [Candidatus Brockarchaeota archaeon]
MRVKIGYWAPQERYDPSTLLENTILAEKNGFETVVTSDHFHPWFHTNASSGFAWVWMAAVAERTSKMEVGTGVTAPTMRYHPAIVAQAFATLGSMYPGRIPMGVGTGAEMNEMPLGFGWSKFKARLNRLKEAIEVIRALWSGEFVSYEGEYYKLRNARIYALHKKPIPIFVGAGGPKSAELAGKLADGLLTVVISPEHYKQTIVPAFEKGAREAGKDPEGMEKMVELKVSFDEDYEKAEKSCRCWMANEVPNVISLPISDPRKLEELGKREGGIKAWHVTTDPEEHVKLIEEHIKLGFTRIQLNSSSPDEKKFIARYGKEVLPYFKEEYGENRK